MMPRTSRALRQLARRTEARLERRPPAARCWTCAHAGRRESLHAYCELSHKWEEASTVCGHWQAGHRPTNPL
ncbi:MAG: hypothetical protein M5U01_10015 [Ardenticatenaceae bacterium]|nr:hypothetical protein [Ardenticatenaceae bacterium]